MGTRRPTENENAQPDLPIPEPLRGAEYDSFAYHSIVERLPRIGRRVLAENDFSPETQARLETLLDSIPQGEIRLLRDVDAPDTAAWVEYVAPHLDQDWLQVPWFFAETYFYRRILEAISYFQPGSERHDPFAPHKAQSLHASWEAITTLARQQVAWQQRGWDEASFYRLSGQALWGNQKDLSMWPTGEADQPAHGDEAGAQAHLLLDDSAAVATYLAQLRPRKVRVDFLMDNAGLELVGDLALVDYLLASGVADHVVLHLKAHPTFVSDAMPKDVQETLDYLANGAAATQALVRRLRQHLAAARGAARGAARMEMVAHPFWTSPLAMWEMPVALRRSLSEAHLVISKGDANYRRLLGDRHWPFSAPFAQIVSYFPAPLLALRTLKSEVAAGLDPAQVAVLEEEEQPWLTSGRWGMIQAAGLLPAAR